MRSMRSKIIVGALVAMAVFSSVSDLNKIRAKTSEAVDQAALPLRIAKLSTQNPDSELLIPIRGLSKSKIADTWGAPRSGGRGHQGVDMFAPRGTPVLSATEGYVLRTGYNRLGGNYVMILGRGGVRYYYAHLDKFAAGIKSGKKVGTETVLGYVGNTGNAATTPPHLHFGMYQGGAVDPYKLLVSRDGQLASAK